MAGDEVGRRILRVFNNNVVLARDQLGREVVLTGRALGFQARPGQRVDESKVVRTFVPEDGRNPDNVAAMLASIAPEHLQIADEVLAPVWAERGLEPSSATVLAVADHISFAIKRARQAIEVDYPLRAEIAHLYPRELAWGERIVTTLNQRLDVQLPPEEAVPLALHLVNAAFNTGNLTRTYQMTGVFSQIFDVIEQAYDQRLDRTRSTWPGSSPTCGTSSSGCIPKPNSTRSLARSPRRSAWATRTPTVAPGASAGSSNCDWGKR